MLPFNLFVAAAWALDESPFFYPENQVSRQHSNWMSNKDLTISYMAKNLGFTEKEIQISSDFTDHRQVRHVHVTRLVNGVPVANNNAGFHLSNGKVTWTSSFHASRPKLNFNAPKPAISMDKAIKIAEHALNCSKDDTPSVMEYLQISSTDVAYVYSFQLRDDRQSLWLRVSVDVNSGSILQIVDYGSDASYRAIQLPKSLPTDGFELVAEPQYLSSSPLGWHLDTVDTSGNNVDVFIDIKDPITNLTTRERPVADTKGIFESPWNATESPQTEANRNASSTHLFYIANMVHDIMYQFGFNEVAGNFQKSNMGKGGKESDQVLMSNQNNGGKNNANFRTPPDGMNGLCNMYLWNFIEPMRDGSLDTRIPIHELVHGVSNRLTGGSQNGVCLSVREARGYLCIYLEWAKGGLMQLQSF